MVCGFAIVPSFYLNDERSGAGTGLRCWRWWHNRSLCLGFGVSFCPVATSLSLPCIPRPDPRRQSSCCFSASPVPRLGAQNHPCLQGTRRPRVPEKGKEGGSPCTWRERKLRAERWSGLPGSSFASGFLGLQTPLVPSYGPLWLSRFM